MTKYIEELKATAVKFKTKLEKIKVLAFDCDGILTDSKVFWAGEEAGFSRSFNINDGYGMKFMQRNGFKVGVITGGNSKGVHERFINHLKLDFLFSGKENKLSALEEIKEMGFQEEEILYMGDELFDIPILEKIGFAATVPEAFEDVRNHVDYVTKKSGGSGSAREVIEIIRYAQDLTYAGATIYDH